MLYFYVNSDRKLFEIDEEDVKFYNAGDIFSCNVEDLPDAFYPFYKLDENGAIIEDEERVLEKAKVIHIENIEREFDIKISIGFTCSNGIKLFATFNDIQKYKAGLDLVQKLNKDTTYIKDYDGVYHNISTTDLDSMIIELGLYYLGLWKEQGELIEQVKNATNLDEVLNVKWSDEQ